MSAASAHLHLPNNDAPFSVYSADGWFMGPMRFPTNNSHHEAGTIHDDATARDLGFRSGTIAGSIHMEQFLPLCEHAFGREWSRTGSLSLYFLNPSVDREGVQAMIGSNELAVAGCRQRFVQMKTSSGLTVLEGSASVGAADHASAVRERFRQRRPATPDQVRILAGVPDNFSATNLPTMIPQADIDVRLAIITERRAEFSDARRFGHAVAPLSAAVHAMRVFENALPLANSNFVGMFGAIDWQFLNGPVFADHAYLVDGCVLAIGESRKTEMLWYECTLRDTTTDQEIARMLMLSRLLKSTSPLWCDTAD